MLIVDRSWYGLLELTNQTRTVLLVLVVVIGLAKNV